MGDRLRHRGAVVARSTGLRAPERIQFPVYPWLLWVGYMGSSLFWLDEATFMQVQAAVQMSMPLLVGTLASLFIRSRRTA